MADDREILRELWDGKVPVCFNLADEEVYGVEQPEAFYLLVPRQSYFSLATDKVQRHFLRHVDPQKVSEMWLESEGQPLKWHYPIGVLFDIYGADSTLPWNLTVHFQNFPEDELLHCTSREVVEAQYMAMVKEADTLKHKAQIINGMQRKDHKQLWMGLQNDKFDQFWSINRKLMEHTGDEPFKYIPFRIYQPEKNFIQKLIKPQNEDGEYHTLEDLLREFLPEVLLSLGEKYKVVLQGVEVPVETSLQWLSEHFSHPDNFLHICVLPV